MTRHEDGGSIDREELKQEIRREIKKDERNSRLMRMVIMLSIVLLLLAAPFLVAGVLVAKSGLVHVPVLSGWLYNPVSPSRTVTPLLGSSSEVIMNSAITRADFNPNFGSVKIYLTEKELTTVLNSAISKDESGALPFSVESVQAVLSEGSVEIYALAVRDDGMRVSLLVGLVPAVEQGRLTMDSTSLIIGSLKMPDFVADLIVDSMTGGLAGAINDALAGGGTLENVEVSKERVTVMLMAAGRR